MEKFEKSILNYFAAYTETRFNFQKKTDYKWTDNTLTVDFSVFPKFQNKILNAIKNGKQFNFEIKRGDYTVFLEENIFKQIIVSKIKSNYNLEYLKNCLEQSQVNFQKTYTDNVILSGEEGNQVEVEQNTFQQEEFQRKIFLDGTRIFNLAFRKCIKDILFKLQKEKIEQLKAELRFKYQPISSLNPHSIRKIFFSNQRENTKIFF